MMRKGKNFYPEKYEAAIKLMKEGKTASQISNELGISYSCAYHWIKGLRKPEQGRVEEFMSFIKKQPVYAGEIKSLFPKHNDLFLIASKRGLGIRRFKSSINLTDFSTWYYIDGQEKQLEEKIAFVRMRLSKIKDSI